MNEFGAVIARKKKPKIVNADIIRKSVSEEDNFVYSFAVKVTYIGKKTHTEILEFLWHNGKILDPEVLRDATFERVVIEHEFDIPDCIKERIVEKAKKLENEFHKAWFEERDELIKHLEKIAEEKEKEGKIEDAKRVREEIERRKNANPPPLKVRVEPVALLVINAPVETHQTVLKNSFVEKEIHWKFNNLTGKSDLVCEKCGTQHENLYLTVDGMGCKHCTGFCSVCNKPMLNFEKCKVCSAVLCENHVHKCEVCGEALCDEHAHKCSFCNTTLCDEHASRCYICGATLCKEHTYVCAVCGNIIGPRHARICDICGRDVCPEHIHKCEICGKNICENCGVEIDGKWYCKEHLVTGYGGKLVFPELKCKTCSVYLSKGDAIKCSVCGDALCPEHALKCDVCGTVLCEEHSFKCSICGKILCENHTVMSEISGKTYCREHTTRCPVCGRSIGTNELQGSICVACASMTPIDKRDVPSEIFKKYPYSKKGKVWYISRAKNVAYITRIGTLHLAYRIVEGEIIEWRNSDLGDDFRIF